MDPERVKEIRLRLDRAVAATLGAREALAEAAQLAEGAEFAGFRPSCEAAVGSITVPVGLAALLDEVLRPKGPTLHLVWDGVGTRAPLPIEFVRATKTQVVCQRNGHEERYSRSTGIKVGQRADYIGNWRISAEDLARIDSLKGPTT